MCGRGSAVPPNFQSSCCDGPATGQARRPGPAADPLLLTVDPEVVVKRRHDTVCVDRYVKVVVHQEVVPRSLADDSKVVDVGFLLARLEVEVALGHAGTVVCRPRYRADAGDALWIVVRLDVKAAIAVAH